MEKRVTHRERAEAVQAKTDGWTAAERVVVMEVEFAAVEKAALERAAKECGDADRGWTPGYVAASRIRALAKEGGT